MCKIKFELSLQKLLTSKKTLSIFDLTYNEVFDMGYTNLVMNYETSFEIYKQAERLKDGLINSITNEFLDILKEECLKRNLVFISIEQLDKNQMAYDFHVNVSGYDIRIDIGGSKLSQRKRIKTALNRVRKQLYPVLAISGAEYTKAKHLNLLVSSNGSIGYIKSEDYYGKCQMA